MKKIIFFLIFLILNTVSSKIYAEDKDVNFSLKSSELTFGTAKKNIKPGVTTQEEIVNLFGSADNMIMREGKETWIYDKITVESSSKADGSFINLLIIGGGNRTSSTSTKTKNLTLIIKFDSKGIVQDFNIRSGGY